MFAKPRGWLGRAAGWWMARSNRPLAAWAVAGLTLGADDRVLEIGCGPGVGLALAAKHLPAGLIVGIDPSATMQRQAARRNRAAVRGGRVALARAVVSRLPFADRQFQHIMSVNGIQLWPDPVAGLAEVHRGMRPGARLVVIMHAHGTDNDAEVRTRQARCLEWIAASRLRTVQAISTPVRGRPALRAIAERIDR